MPTTTLALVLMATLGLQTPAAPDPALPAGPNDFDFLEGQWDLVYNSSRPGIPPNVKGRWTASKQADGRVLYDEFRLFGPDGRTVNLGVTYRIFDHVRGRWDMRYATVLSAVPGQPSTMPAGWADLTAWREGNDIRVDQIGRTTRLRIRYYDITKERFSWKADVSTDGGKTWDLNQTRIEARRAGASGPSTEEVTWTSGPASIAGTLRLPKGEGPFPAAIIAPGSGTIGRSHAIPASHADRLTDAGMAVLIFDKRGVGRSTGHWREQSFSDYADDLDAGLALLRRHPRIDPQRIGIIGHSQGGWTAPLAASRSRVAFLVLAASTPLSPLEQALFVHDRELRARGLPTDQRDEALRLYRQVYEVYATDQGWDAVRQAISDARTRPWFEPSAFALQDRVSWNWQWLNKLPFTFDVTPVLSRLDVPLLTINGELDRLVPAEPSRDLYERIRRAGGRQVESIVLPALHHGLGVAEKAVPHESYWRALIGWLRTARILRSTPPEGP